MNYSNSQRVGVILHLTALLFGAYCLSDKWKTIAVLAHGLNMIYPASNKKLFQKILLFNGTLLSEYPVGTKPDKFRFIN